MFSVVQKRKVAEAIEKVLLELKHPEMPTEKIHFNLHVDGIANWSWADIEPNWIFDDGHKKIEDNPFNELEGKDK